MTDEEERLAWLARHKDLTLRVSGVITSRLAGQQVSAGLKGLVAVLEEEDVSHNGPTPSVACPCSLAFSLLPMAMGDDQAEQAQADFTTLLALVSHPTTLVLGLMALGAAFYAATIRAGGPEEFASLVAWEVP